MRRFLKILLCLVVTTGLLYAPVVLADLTGTQMVAEAHAATVKLNKKKITLRIAASTKLKVSGGKQKVKWSSSNEKVATVTSKGIVKGKKAGTATITAKIGKKKLTCKITVKRRIFVGKKTVTLAKTGKTAKVQITNVGKGKVVNRSTNRAVATSKWSKKWNGNKNILIITAKKPGTAYIKLTNAYSKEVCKIKVVVKKPSEKPADEAETVPTPEVYHITYQLGGGVNPASNPSTYTAGEDVVLQAPSLEDYDFDGWYLDESCTKPTTGVTAETTGDLTFYAKWKPSEDLLYRENMSKVKPENMTKAMGYVDGLYEKNKDVEPLTGSFSWQLAAGKPSWIYYTGLVHDGFMMLNEEKYYEEVREFYTAHIREDGTIQNYVLGTLDAALPAVNMLSLLESGKLTEEEQVRYEKGINYVYHQLELQTLYPQAGNLMLHTQEANGEPRAGWTRWNICLDGIYMSQLFLLRTAELIDDGTLVVKSRDGHLVSSEEIWNDVYQRLAFVMEQMRDEETGLPYHGYCVAEGVTNGGFWTRGIGWYAMVLMEAAEKMPNPTQKAVLTEYYAELMDAVMKVQDKETLLWYNVPDCKGEVSITHNGVTTVNQTESSGSSMLAYALLRGYHNGLLQREQYRAAGLQAFNALVETKLTDQGLTDHIHSSAVHTSPSMYQISGYMTDDGKGVGPFIMAVKYAY